MNGPSRNWERCEDQGKEREMMHFLDSFLERWKTQVVEAGVMSSLPFSVLTMFSRRPYVLTGTVRTIRKYL
jgi:hypothetical protein